MVDGKLKMYRLHTKTICFAMYPHFGHIYSEMGKENKLAFRNYIIYLPYKLYRKLFTNYYKTLFTKIIYIKK